jgi:hypothetical protein
MCIDIVDIFAWVRRIDPPPNLAKLPFFEEWVFAQGKSVSGTAKDGS